MSNWSFYVIKFEFESVYSLLRHQLIITQCKLNVAVIYLTALNACHLTDGGGGELSKFNRNTHTMHPVSL